jgi:hypothetical protein
MTRALGIALLLTSLPGLAFAATPTLVQHVATGMTNQPVTTFTITLPNRAGAGNALILGVQFKSSGSISAVADDMGNPWTPGPSVTNGGLGGTMSLFYALNIAGGTQQVTVTFNGLSGIPGHAQAVLSEFYNVAPVSALDGSSTSASSRTPGTVNTTVNGDLVYEWGAALSAATDNGGTYNGASIAAGTNFTLLSADLQVGSADQYQVQPLAGALTPTFSATGASTWGSLALALKSATAGTPPASGIRIVNVQYTLIAAPHSQNRTTPTSIQFPSSGNLLVGLLSTVGEHITSMTDSTGNAWVSAVTHTNAPGVQTAQIVYAANASTGPTLSGITPTLSAPCSYSCFLILYDVAGASSAPIDVTDAAEGDSAQDADLTMLSLTPTTSNGLMFNAGSWYWHTANGVHPPATFAAVVNGAENNDSPCCTDSSTLNDDDPYALYYNPDTSPVSFTYSHTTSGPGGNVGVHYWVSVGAAFKGDASSSSSPPPSSPGVISLSASSYSVREGDGGVTITAQRTGGSGGSVDVTYTTVDGTAVAGADYISAVGGLSWADGDTSSKTFVVPILTDTVAEGNETFTVELRNPRGGATLGSPGSATVTIQDGGLITIGQTSVLTGQGWNDGNSIQGIKAALAQTATIQSLSIYFRAAAGHSHLSIYDDKSNYPGKLKAQTAEFTPSVGWNTQNVTSPVSLSAGTYWLIWQTDNNSMGVAYNPNGTNAGVYKGLTYAAPPANFPSGGGASPDESIYATLLAAGGSGGAGGGGGSGGGSNAAPTVATPAAASPNPVLGLTTTLSALGADDGGEANLTYTWATSGTPPAPVTFSANGTNAAKTVTATFARTGTYSVQVTLRDAGGLAVTSTTTVTVNATLTGITVTPASASVATGGTQAFTATALDQFGAALPTQPPVTWSASGGGTITSSGNYSTTFAATENPISESGVWVTGKATGIDWSDVRTTSNLAFGTQTGANGYDDSIAVLTGTWGPNQSAQATVYTVNQPSGNVFEEVELLLRFQITSGVARGYEVNFSINQGYAQVVHWNGALDSYRSVDSRAIPTLRTGDMVAATVTGMTTPTIALYLNGALLFSVTDTGANPWIDGNPGIGFYLQSDGSCSTCSPTDYGFTAYSVSDGVTGPGVFTAGSTAGGPYTVTASSGSVIGTASVTVTAAANAPPTVATPAVASPNPVAGTTTTLSVLGADDGGEAALTYTWAATGTPPAPVAFSANGTNAAKTVAATFTKAGIYGLQVTIRDAGALTVTSSTTVTVNATLTGITVTPTSASVATGGTQAFTATGLDQFGLALPTQPPVTWSASGGGTISTAGLFTAGSTAGGPYTVTAASGGITGTANVTVTAAANAPPTVATPAGASPNPTAGTTTTLSVLGADNGGEAALTYTWATTGTPPAPVTFSANGTNAAKTVAATFAKAGIYSLQATIRDAGGLTVTSSTTVTVNATLTGITVTPASASVATGGTQAFTATALDQFGIALPTQPPATWSASGGGTISTAGLFTAGSTAGGPYTVSATSGGITGTGSVTVTASTSFTVGTTTALSSQSSNDASVLLAYKVSLPKAATIQSLSIYTRKTGGKVYMGIYADSAGYPGVLKAATAEFTPKSGWNTQSVTVPISLPAGTYWLVYEPSSNSFGTGYDAGGSANNSFERSTTYGPMPSTFPAGGRANRYRFSLYATFQ